MTSSDDRKGGSGREEAQERRATARRNRLLGLWAGGLMGLEDQHLEDYASAVVRSETAPPEDEDVQRKVARDLAGAGLKVTEDQVRGKMDEFQAVARGQVQSEG
ncbi:MAG TPA: DUF1476 domain-containing protein [Caulobacteraceae bacterium]|jgi:hypothetical protein|nr:DUF1476 domain-containing protein [Caulobacteraceae bacterium]